MAALKQSEWRFVLVNVAFAVATVGGALLLAMTLWGSAAATNGVGIYTWGLILLLIVALPALYSVALDWAFGAFRKSHQPEQEYF